MLLKLRVDLMSEMNIYTLTVSELNMRLKKLVDSVPALKDIWIKGEISNFKLHYSGHIYMTLKDDGGVLRAVMFRSAAEKLRFNPENGMKVLARGRISIYERDGSYQLYIEQMQPDGIGDLHMAYEQLKARLEKEGLFSQQHKKPIPEYPAVIGVVTASTGAAIRDIINILKRRYPLSKVILYPALVQGEGAAPDIVRGIEYFNEKDLCDVLIVGRGGGSIEDLWAFNEEITARAIYNSHIPVISAVGHETDFTIADFVSDLRAPTPSAAAELATPSVSELRQRISLLLSKATSSELALIKAGRLSLARLEVKNPKPVIDDMRLDAEALVRRLILAQRNNLSAKKEEFKTAAGRLDAMSPLSVIKRGYAVVQDCGGKTVKSINDVKNGDRITLTVTDGKIKCVVE